MGHPTVSVICSTYNNPKYLGLVIEGFRHQTSQNFELIIADDGSTDETKEMVDQIIEQGFPVAIKHVWHEDQGFRLSHIRNKGAVAAAGELLIFMDGDCVPHPRYIEDHLLIYGQNKDRRYVFMGRRTQLGEAFSNELSRSNVYQRLLAPMKWGLLKDCIMRDSRGYLRSFSFKNKLLRSFFKADRIYDLIGSNFSLTRENLIFLGGFDENYHSYYGEDGEFFVRSRNNGCKMIGKKYFAVQYHLFHHQKPFTREQEQQYFDLLEDKEHKTIENGISKYL